MFCMAWFMELSRLSNSLGSACSQRRGRLAAVAGRPQLPHSFLSHPVSRHAPPIPSLLRHQDAVCFAVCFCPLIVLMSVLHWVTCKGILPACPERTSVPSDTGPSTNRVPETTVECCTMLLCQQDFGFQPPFTLPSPPHAKTQGVNVAVAWSLVRVPIASPAVQSDILHSVCTRQVLSRESGARERSGDCGGSIENWESLLESQSLTGS